MTTTGSPGIRVYDPRGVVSAEKRPLAARPKSLEGLRLGVLSNTKWNAGSLLRRTVGQLGGEGAFAAVTFYEKESFSKDAAPALIAEIAGNSDVVLTAIGD